MRSDKSGFAGSAAAAGGTGILRAVPVWVWRLLMRVLRGSELARFNSEPIEGVEHYDDIDFVGDDIRAHRLDVIVPRPTPNSNEAEPEPAALPVYVYFHGGGWTSGDKAPLTKYCASQAVAGMIVVNVNYRMATRFKMKHMLQDANAALGWIGRNIAEYGGDPDRIVLGGDSAGGQIAAMITAASFQPELAAHYELTPSTPAGRLRGLVQHCSAVDFSVHFDKGFILSLNFIRMLLPPQVSVPGPVAGRGKHHLLRLASRFLSPIEWLDVGFPPVFVTTSERDYFYRANLNFVATLRRNSIPVETLIYDRTRVNTQHTWQQNYRYPESQEVYRRLQSFVKRVAALS
ncbi:MAG: alpha/beta hydrolase [Lacisediminihabitans sp.]